MMENKSDFISYESADMIKDGTAMLENNSGTFYCLSIIGQIEGHYVLDNTQKTTSGAATEIIAVLR